MRTIAPALIASLFLCAGAGAEGPAPSDREAARALPSLSPAEASRVLEEYGKLSPEEQRSVREHAGELGRLDPDEKAWALEHPESLRALGRLPEAERDGVVDAYRELPAKERERVRDHADELRELDPKERAWALENPEAVRALGELPAAERGAVVDAYRRLSPEGRRSPSEGAVGR